MPKTLLTGGAGFIGAHVCRELIRSNHEVVVLDDLSGGFVSNLPNEAQFVEGSITDESLITELFERHSFHYVYHLAAYAAEGLSHYIKRFNYTNNLIGSVNLINASVKHDIKCFVFTSSIAVYGKLKSPLHEEMIASPVDPYGIAKLAVEQDLAITKEIFDLDYIVFRPHNVYGEFQNLGDKYRNVIGIFMNQLMQGKALTIFGDGEQSRAFSYIGDIAPMIANSINVNAAYNQVFNIGSEATYSVNQLADQVIKSMGIEGSVRHVEERHEVKHAYSDHSKLHSIFGSHPTTTLAQGLDKMWSWAKEEGVKASKKFEEIEIRRNLPPVWLED